MFMKNNTRGEYFYKLFFFKRNTISQYRQKRIYSIKNNIMPYSANENLPDSVRHVLPKHAQDIYREAFNNAWHHYADPAKRRPGTTQEQTAHAVAWTAVETKYKKNTDGVWVEK